MATHAPTGVITLVFTDIQGSTQLWEKMGNGFRPMLDRHNELIRELIERWDGYEVKSQGDSFMIAFARGTDAVQCGLDIQLALHNEPWPPALGEILVRIGMHTGEPFLGYDPAGRPDYFGPMVNRAARVSAAGHGGQILLSSATKDVLSDALSEDFALEDLGTHRLRGLEDAPENIFGVVHALLPERRYPALRTLDTVRTNLPPQPGTFVGRDEELAQLRALLQREETRLVTLLGFGGMGKTRTALQLADRCIHDFKDGVWWVEVEEARNSEAMWERIAYDLRLPLQPQPSVREQVLAHLRDRTLLLVLDNTEQVTDPAKCVREILQHAPQAKVLVTSRRALELQAERLIEIRPLPLEDAERLFVERARTRKADFTLNADNATDVRELVRRLEGVPLAIELAAPRIVGMSPREINQRLRERFRVLQSRSPELPDRQRALRGSIDWSHELLSEDDRSLFAQLSVFAGGFALADAEDICDAMDVFEGVMELRRQSLLRTETDAATQETRYLMLEYVREYATEKLDETGPDADEVRERHADYYLKYAEKRSIRMRTRGEVQALDELGAQADNLRTALAFSHERGNRETTARLAVALYQWLYRRGLWPEAKRALETGLESVAHPAAGEREMVARIQHYLSSLLLDLDDNRAALELARRNLDLWREIGKPDGTAEALNLLGLMTVDHGAPEEARQLLDEALSLLGPRDNSRRGMALHNLARLVDKLGEKEEARVLYEDALRCRRAAGDARGEAETLGNLGVKAHYARDYAEARTRYHESLAINRALRDRRGIAVMLTNLGELAEGDEDLERAVVLFIHAERMFQELQSAAELRYVQGNLDSLRERVGEAQWMALQSAANLQGWEELV